MPRNIYVGIDGYSRPISNAYIGINGVARKIKAMYIGLGGVAHQFYPSTGSITITPFTIISNPNGNIDTHSYMTVSGMEMRVYSSFETDVDGNERRNSAGFDIYGDLAGKVLTVNYSLSANPVFTDAFIMEGISGDTIFHDHEPGSTVNQTITLSNECQMVRVMLTVGTAGTHDIYWIIHSLFINERQIIPY